MTVKLSWMQEETKEQEDSSGQGKILVLGEGLYGA